jgi:DNA-binding LacI/PurR family transcriptional regulator
MTSTQSLLEPVDRPASQQKIAQHIRDQIVSGRLQLGGRLPTRTELKQHFGTTSATVQRAFDTLIEQGFVSAEGRRGTFVSPHPPHLRCYGLVFPGRPNRFGEWDQFCLALGEQARRREASANGGLKFSQFFQVDQHRDSDDYHRLVHEVRTHQLAGLIFSSYPYYLEDTPLLRDRPIPMVVVASSPNRLAIPAVAIDYDSFYSKALKEVAQCGRKRVAFVRPITEPEVRARAVQRMIAEHGLTTKPYWSLPIVLEAAGATRSYVHLLMNPDQKTRPDALIVANDNFVPHVLAGLSDAGARIPDDVLVIAHANFPAEPIATISLRRLGFDVRQVLETLTSLIQRQQEGKKVPNLTTIKAQFEELEEDHEEVHCTKAHGTN